MDIISLFLGVFIIAWVISGIYLCLSTNLPWWSYFAVLIISLGKLLLDYFDKKIFKPLISFTLNLAGFTLIGLDIWWLLKGPYFCDYFGWPKYLYFVILYAAFAITSIIFCIDSHLKNKCYQQNYKTNELPKKQFTQAENSKANKAFCYSLINNLSDKISDKTEKCEKETIQVKKISEKQFDFLLTEINELKNMSNSNRLQVKQLSSLMSAVTGKEVMDIENLSEEYADLLDSEKIYELLMKPLSSFCYIELNRRIVKSLRNAEILSMFHLCQCSRKDILNIHGLGSASVNYLTNELKEYYSEGPNGRDSYRLSLGMDVHAYVERHDRFVELKKNIPKEWEENFVKLVKQQRIAKWRIRDMCLSRVLTDDLDMCHLYVKDVVRYKRCVLREKLKKRWNRNDREVDGLMKELDDFIAAHDLSWELDVVTSLEEYKSRIKKNINKNL